jgi:hypothetical protein
VEGADFGTAINVTFVNGVSQVNTTTLQAFKAETATVDVTDGSINSSGHGLNLTVNPASPNYVSFVTQPTNTVAGSIISPSVTAELYDIYDNPVTTDNSSTVTVAIGTNPGGGTLSGTLTRTVSGGIATFNDISINKIGTGYTLTASSGVITGDTSNTFNITPAAASVLGITTQPSGATAGSNFTTQPVIQTYDAFGNLSTVGLGASEIVTVTINTGTGPLQGTVALDIGTGAGNGTVSYTNLRDDVAQTGLILNFDSPNLNSVNSSPFNVSASTATTLGVFTQPSNSTAGINLPTQPVIKTYDAYGNPSTVGLGASEIVTVTINTGTGPLQGTVALDIGTGAGNGTVSYTNLRDDVAQTGLILNFDSPNLNSVNANAIDISAATATVLTITTQPSGATAGSAFTTQPVIQTYDAYGNPSTVGLAANQIVTVTINSGTGPLQGTVNLDIGTSAGNGTVTYTNLRDDVSQSGLTLNFTSTGFAPVTSSPFSVSPAAATRINVETAADGSGSIIASQSLNSADSLTGYAITRDDYGNFIGNVAATWSLIDKTGGVADGDLAPAADNKSAVFTANQAGSCRINAAFGGYFETPSGILSISSVSPVDLALVDNSVRETYLMFNALYPLQKRIYGLEGKPEIIVLHGLELAIPPR